MPIIQKMLLTLLSIALIPVFVVGSSFFLEAQSSLRERELDRLEAIATLQQGRVSGIIQHNQELLDSFTSRLTLRRALDRYNRTPSEADRATLQQVLTETRAGVKSFRALMVLSPTGTVIASTRTTEVGNNYRDEAYFVRGKETENVTDMFFRDDQGRRGLYLTGPLMLDGRLVGVAVIEWDTSSLLAATKDYTGLGETGEIVLVRRGAEGESVSLAPLRFGSTPSGSDMAPAADGGLMARALAKQDRTFTDVKDYRDRAVLAAVRYIPAADWGLVVKIDQTEAYEPLTQLSDLLMTVMFILSVVIIFVAFYLARRLNEPILTLAAAADKVRGGDLSARARVSTKDEIGQLAGTFNAMANTYEKVDQMKSEFVLLASHQLRTPATAVKGFVSMLLDGYAGKLSPKQHELIAAAFTENERQISVINSILDVAKLEAGEMALVRAHRDVAEVIEASAAGQAPLLASKRQKLAIRKPKGPVILWVDAEKLQLVIDNFIHNAIKYSPPDTTITVELKHTPQLVTIRVSDEGIGIAQRDLHRLFKRFSRITTPQTVNVQGAGLGLYLAEKLVTMHGGKIRIHSREGKGTTFSIELPVINEKET